MSLGEYKRKRDFGITPEPAGKEVPRGGRSFVIQKHQASHLHYDFRLEMDGVLKSWAVPKGPCLDPAVKRLAMQVEDHPVDYGSFEGIIPEGEYGGGTVMIWDRGEWEPLGNAKDDYRKGRLKFQLAGEKLKGKWMLVRTAGAAKPGAKKAWLLFKERDEWAKSGEAGDIVSALPLSVATGRDLEEIAKDQDWVWGKQKKTSAKKSKTEKKAEPEKSRAASKSKPRKQASLVASMDSLSGAKTARLPARIDVQLATLVKEPPEGDDWFHEIKFDGYRMICRIEDGKARFITRNHKDWTNRLKTLVQEIESLGFKNAVLDGEVVALRPDGTSDFQELQNAFRENQSSTLDYFVFDLLYWDRYDLRSVPLEERKRLLGEILEQAQASKIHFSQHMEGHAEAFLKQGCAMHLEGIICKKKDGAYRSGRGYEWLKVKCIQTDEFVIGGFTEPSGSRPGLGALLMGYHDDAGKLCYVGKVGTGFSGATHEALQKELAVIECDRSPFRDHTVKPARTHWVKPTKVAQVVYGSRTRDGILRHASFQGLREDKPARDVSLDLPLPLEKVTRALKKQSPSSKSAKRVAAMSANRVRPAPAKKKSMKEPASKLEEFVTDEWHGVRLTHPQKVLYPEDGITKLDLATYYDSVAEWILPHLVKRPVVLVRCPEGTAKECFYQKHPMAGTPDTLRQIPIREKSATKNYLVIDDKEGLISLAQIGALEIHAWGSREDKLESPDRLIFDLDPDPAVPWAQVVDSACEVRQFLKELKLESFVKTTGGKGLHLVLPLERRHLWDEAKDFCKQVADLIVAAAPERYTANMSKAARHGKIFIDYLRNGRGATAIVPYSTRARAGAPISVPLDWKELSAKMPSDHFNIRNIAERLGKIKRDPWEAIVSTRQNLSAPLKQINRLTGA